MLCCVERFIRPERPPDISKKELEEIAFIRANIKEGERSKQALLSEKNLEKYNFIEPKTRGMLHCLKNALIQAYVYDLLFDSSYYRYGCWQEEVVYGVSEEQ